MLQLYTYYRSISTHRVRIALNHKGVNYASRYVDQDRGQHQDEKYLRLNPQGLVPALVLEDETVVTQSFAILEYLEERYPHPPLLPVYPVARAESRLFMYRVERDWCSLVDTILHSSKGSDVSVARRDLGDSLTALSPIFAEKPFFMSEEFTLVDCCIAPILWRLPALGVDIKASKQTKPLYGYMDSLFGREAFQESLSIQEREMRA